MLSLIYIVLYTLTISLPYLVASQREFIPQYAETSGTTSRTRW